MPESRRTYRAGGTRPEWDASGVQALRRHLGLTQRELAEELGVRQQTVSEWETGMYRPRGASRRLLGLVAERAGFPYGGVGSRQSAAPSSETCDAAVGEDENAGDEHDERSLPAGDTL
jgi:transcriptional regulator with XRE-family HTH domain